ncbi:kinase-associated lipoprotein B [Pseudalkalibacillus berkeleyi]|uniref:Kinase-associated lipoprotein B n=1 Tax=Pseudalkalibacillus berkeleyi TaxID=1069813 RepID=A0ABS9H094_9BACL|nr:kinase-associated lipoprotein B [Pseudalkalibacillus berkeleyi]MCF6137324.1 kinase-associated lipoprotein B [Pseudalkalibacillus berkeleyi]
MDFKIGDYVTASYKTGRYVGEIIDFKPKIDKAVVKVLAVLTHPKQGDLHAPNQVNVQLFHERKALAYTEKALVPLTSMKGYDGEIPEYRHSLLESIQRQMKALVEDDSEYAKASYQRLEILLNEYEK